MPISDTERKIIDEVTKDNEEHKVGYLEIKRALEATNDELKTMSTIIQINQIIVKALKEELLKHNVPGKQGD